MATNLQLINRALREINVISEREDASSEQGSDCLAKLNSMMEIWKENGIELGWFEQSSTADNAPVPLRAEIAVYTNLAILCAPQYGASISMELGGLADRTYRILLRSAINGELDNVDMSHLPDGTGKYGNGYDITSDT